MIYLYYIFLAIPALTFIGCVIGLISAIIRTWTGKIDGLEGQTIMGCTVFGLLAGATFLILIEFLPK